MKKCAILLEVGDEGKIAMIVPDFSKENVLAAISKNLAIEIENINQITASMSYGLYTIKKGTFTSRLVQCTDYSDNENLFVFNVEYIKVID